MSSTTMILVLSTVASMASLYYYSKEKRMLREFMQQSRRHPYHQQINVAIQKKASRYLVLSVLFFMISVPLLLQKFIAS